MRDLFTSYVKNQGIRHHAACVPLTFSRAGTNHILVHLILVLVRRVQYVIVMKEGELALAMH